MIPTILSVDDSSLVRRAVARTFARFACTIIEAENGELGLQQVREHRPDLIVLDYNMPVMDGVEMLKQLRADDALKGTKVIMLTANSNPETVTAVARLGVREYITKPFQEEQLLSKAARLVALVPRAAT
jgi:two-component system cell cycle response regulator